MTERGERGGVPAWLAASLGACAAAAGEGWLAGLVVFAAALPLRFAWRLLSSRLGLLGGALQFALALALAVVLPVGRMALVGRLVLWGAMVMLVAVDNPRRLFVPGAGLLVLTGEAVSMSPEPGTFLLVGVVLLLLMSAAVTVSFPQATVRSWWGGAAVSLLFLVLLGIPASSFGYLAFPRLSKKAPAPHSGDGGEDGGTGGRMFRRVGQGAEGILPMVDLKFGHEMLLSVRPAFFAVVRTEGGGMPPPGDIYWRLDALAEYRGGNWLEDNEFRLVEGKSDDRGVRWVDVQPVTITTQAQVYPARGKVLDRVPAPYPVAKVQLDRLGMNREGGMRPAGILRPPLTSLSGNQLQYWDMALGAEATHPDPRYTDRQTIPSALKYIAEKEAGGKANAYEKIKALREYLFRTCRFSYRFAATGGVDAVEEFVVRRRQGSCSCFASALALMLRAVDVPSRVAVGYTGGIIEPRGGSIIVRECDAHAWVEVYFRGIGWLPVEATPATTAEAFVEGTADLDGAGVSLTDRMASYWSTRILGYTPGRQRDLLRWMGLRLRGWFGGAAAWITAHAVHLVGVFAAVLSAWWLVKGILRSLRERRELSREAPKGMVRLVRSLGRLGLKRKAYETWLEFAEGAGKQGEGLPDLKPVFALYCAVRYGAKPVTDALDAELEKVLPLLPRVWYPSRREGIRT